MAVTVVGWALAGTAQAPRGNHGEGHDRLHQWYLTLRDKKGKSCCDHTDCRPTQSRYNGKDVEVMIDGIWAVVPQDKILNVPSPDLQTHVCAPNRPNSFPLGYVACVVLAPGT